MLRVIHLAWRKISSITSDFRVVLIAASCLEKYSDSDAETQGDIVAILAEPVEGLETVIIT